MTVGLLAAGVVAAPNAFADPGDVADASLWRTSPECRHPKDVVLLASGAGVLEFEYRVVGGEPTTHRSRPENQGPNIHEIKTVIPDRQIVWRAIAREIKVLPGIPNQGDIRAVQAFCGGLTEAERQQLPG